VHEYGGRELVVQLTRVSSCDFEDVYPKGT